MLEAEEAKARLVSHRSDSWRDQAHARALALGPKLAAVAQPLLVPYAYAVGDDVEAERLRDRAAAVMALDALENNELHTVMEALHPSLGAPLTRWWVDAQRQPYGWSSGRRGIRAPHNAEISRERRSRDLEQLLETVGPYAEAADWFAAWAPFVAENSFYPSGAQCFGPLLAAAIDVGGEEGAATFRTLLECGRGENPIAGMDRHVVVALLRSSKEEGWAFIESALLNAQREEGLRHVILEAADEGHPEAFDRIICLCLEHDLFRFPATIRAASVWLGLPANAEQVADVVGRLKNLRVLRADTVQAELAALEGDTWDIYLGLLAIAQFDVEPAVELALRALGRSESDHRAAALQFLCSTELPLERLLPGIAGAMVDADLAVACTAHHFIRFHVNGETPFDIYDALESLARRLPAEVSNRGPVGVATDPVRLDRDAVFTSMIQVIGERPFAALLEFVPAMSPDTRAFFVARSAAGDHLEPEVRDVLLSLVGDRSSYVRAEVVSALFQHGIDAGEAEAILEPLLTRKAGDLRRGIIVLLLSLPADAVLDSARRLWKGRAAQRDAACELLAALERSPAVAGVAAEFLDGRPSPAQQEMLEPLVGEGQPAADDETLGLFNVHDLTSQHIPAVDEAGREFIDHSALRIVKALDDLVHQHRNTPLVASSWQGFEEVLLADVRHPASPFRLDLRTPVAQAEMILPEIFRGWWNDRPTDCRGESDELDVLRSIAAAQLAVEVDPSSAVEQVRADIREALQPVISVHDVRLQHSLMVQHVLLWLLADLADGSVVDECLDAMEAVMALVPSRRVEELADLGDDMGAYLADWRHYFDEICPWKWLALAVLLHNPLLMTAERLRRFYGLSKWFAQPVAGADRHRVNLRLLHAAHAIGAAGDADVYDAFITEDDDGRGPGDLYELTRRRRSEAERVYPTVVPLADRVRQRVIDIERLRGELPTAASHLAYRLGSIEGAELTLDLLSRFGSSSFVRDDLSANLYGGRINSGRDAVFSRLLHISHPAEGDTPERVASLVAGHGFTERQLVEFAMFAPQWASTVEVVLGWTGLEEAVWWFHTHTKDDRWYVEAEVRDTWAALSAERTAVPSEDLTDGAVDVEWFNRAYGALGPLRWVEVHRAAKLASGGAGHRRAQILAEAMTGSVDEADVVGRIEDKRQLDSVRALGLLPLPEGQRDAVALRRYQVLREFERGSKKFGAQRQRSEATAVRIGIENLARTLGGTDPQRFVWRMEVAEIGDLAERPVTVAVDDVVVVLSVDKEGAPDVAVRRGDKVLKAVPAAIRKHADVVSLLDRHAALLRQESRVRRSLEESMVTQVTFSDADFASLARHPVVAPMLGLLIWVDADGATFQRRESTWNDVTGNVGTPTGDVRIAHPVDLKNSQDWIAWQTLLFDVEQRQPFKQVFRELYVLTEAEAQDSPLSRRWSGQQIKARQGYGLFTARGWVSDAEEQEVAKVFHHAGLVARVDFLDGWGTPAEVELPTVGSIHFARRGEHLAQPLASVPPVVFSEAMRDLDMVVSVAHAGGVDPEATASTIDMRAALVRETARLLQLDNVRRQSNHILIDGSLGEYSLHLGSGTVHRRPGGALCIIPVETQRRGRLFLPFADDDPKSAEVLSKVILLARDSRITDPTIVEQLR